MAFGRRTRAGGGATVTTTTTTVEHPADEVNGRHTRAAGTKPTLKQRLFGPRKTRATTATPARRRRAATRRAPVGTTSTAPRRKTSVGDKVSGAMLKLKGSLTRRPGQKAAGTRRMHGTDGRGTRRYY